MPKILRHRQTQVCAALIAADCVVFATVNPSQATALWLITGYLLLGLTLFSLAALAAQAFRSYGEGVYQIAWRFLRYGVLASVLLIGLQSIGQLTTKDILVLAPFVMVAYAYFGYGRRTEPQLAPNK